MNSDSQGGIPEALRTFEPGGLGHAAVVYAKAGWPVFPLTSGTKVPLPRTRGFMDATTDVTTVVSCWTRHPEANVALRTGVVFDVLDVDVRSSGNGFDALERLQRAGLLAGAVAQASTRNGGMHLFYPASGSRGRSWQAHHLDLKADGGYVVAAPSVVPSDDDVQGPGRYDWLSFTPKGDPVRPLDVASIERFLNPSRGIPETPRTSGAERADGNRLVAWVSRRTEGTRNAGLFWAAREAARAGVLTVDLADQLVSAAMGTGQTRREAEATVKSAHRHAGRSSW